MQHFFIRTYLLLSAMVVLGFPWCSVAEDFASPARRPRIGLVLEGGGALGFAHVGVIKVLEENHVPIDFVAGTSMGSIVAGAYASGQTVEIMEHVLATTDWDELFSENPPRQDVPYRYKPGRNREIFGSAKVGIGNDGMVLPVGMIQGQKVLPLLQRLFGNVPSPVDFDKLPVPFRAVSADIETGESVVFSKGDLATVVRASMSVPGVFAPIEIDGRMLVDGGITDNLPVALTRSLGADVLIVVALETDPVKVSELTSPFAISGRVIDLLLAQNSQQSLKLLHPGDLLIQANLGKYGAGDFANAKEIMAIGEARAREMVNEIRRFAVPEEEFHQYLARRTGEKIPPVTIDFVKLDNDSRTPDELLRAEFGVKEGDKFDRDAIEAGIQRIFNSGWYTDVKYAVETEGDKNGVVLTVRRRKWFDNYLRFGLALEDDFQGDGNYRLGLNWRTTSLNDYGAYADFIGEIGKSPYISGEWYQPMGVASPYFIAPSAEYGLSSIDVMSDGDSIAKYDRIIGSGSLRIGREIGTVGEAAVGVTRGEGQLRRDIGDPTLQDLDYEIGDLFAGFVLDALDTPDFPTDGYLLRFAYKAAKDDLGSTSEFEDYTASTTLPITFGRTTLLIGGELGLTPEDRPIERSYSLGGFLNVSGYQPNSLLASDFWAARLAAYHRFSELKIPLFGFGFFVGSSVEFTSIRSDIEQIPDDPSIVSGSVFVGADTPLIPAYLSFGLNDESSQAVTFNLGRIGSFRR